MQKRQVLVVVFFLILLIPMIFLANVSLQSLNSELTELALARRQTIAYLASNLIQERLDRQVDLGKSLASRAQLRQLIEQGRWKDAIKTLESVMTDFPDVDRIFLTDPDATLYAISPDAPELIGQNFSHRDWYAGITKNWESYVSEVYQRSSQPQIRVISVVTPVRNNKGKVIAILGMQFALETFSRWMNAVDVGKNGYVYVVDQKGKIIANPEQERVDGILDYSQLPAVQKIMKGERGVEVLYNPIAQEERLSAFVPVSKYGWGVIAQQPTKTAFAQRDQTLKFFIALYGVIIALSGLFVMVALLIVSSHRLHHDIQK